jgi:hypothetical protein
MLCCPTGPVALPESVVGNPPGEEGAAVAAAAHEQGEMHIGEQAQTASALGRNSCSTVLAVSGVPIGWLLCAASHSCAYLFDKTVPTVLRKLWMLRCVATQHAHPELAQQQEPVLPPFI